MTQSNTEASSIEACWEECLVYYCLGYYWRGLSTGRLRSSGLFLFSGPGAMSTRGQFGDLFGAVTAFFTGLAFAGVIYTIYLQTVELESSRQAQAEMIVMEKRRKAMEFISRFNDEYMVGLRAKAASALKAGTWKKEEHSVRAYLNFFEEMALAVDNDLADAELCRRYLRIPLLHVYTGAEDVFKGDPGTYIQLKNLARKWESSSSPNTGQ